MNLPIDVIPGTSPPRFKWSQVVETPNGRQVIEHEGVILPSVEVAIAQLIGTAKKLQEFKDWIHNYLDNKHVPTVPPDAAGECLVSDRLEWVFMELEKYKKLNEGMAERIAAQSETLSKKVESSVAKSIVKLLNDDMSRKGKKD